MPTSDHDRPGSPPEALHDRFRSPRDHGVEIARGRAPSAGQRTIYRLAHQQIERNIDSLRPGMTPCIESTVGHVEGAEGVRLEEQVLVTESSVERLSSFPFEADLPARGRRTG